MHASLPWLEIKRLKWRYGLFQLKKSVTDIGLYRSKLETLCITVISEANIWWSSSTIIRQSSFNDKQRQRTSVLEKKQLTNPALNQADNLI